MSISTSSLCSNKINTHIICLILIFNTNYYIKVLNIYCLNPRLVIGICELKGAVGKKFLIPGFCRKLMGKKLK